MADPDRVSFHGVFDDPRYFAIRGDAAEVSVPGGDLIVRIDAGCVTTGPWASFGGITFAQALVSCPMLEAHAAFLADLERGICEQFKGVSKIVLRMATADYYPESFLATFEAACAVQNWRSAGEISYVVKAEASPPTAKHRSARRAERRGAGVTSLEPIKCFDFLASVKADKGYPFAYSRESFVAQVDRFPYAFGCYGVECEHNLVAAVLEAYIGDGALLVSWDQSLTGKAIAATDYLLVHRIGALKDAGKRFVDLGTVSFGRRPNWGLARHKGSLGGIATLRRTYEWVARTREA